MIHSSLCLTALLFCGWTISAQDKRSQQLPAPPPMVAVSPEERALLSEAKDSKARIRKTVELAQIRLKRAEVFTEQQQFDRVLTELGGYQGLIEDGFKFLGKMNNDRGRVRDLYKHIEIDLREDTPRLFAMRRITPLEYGIRIKEVEEFARAGRTEALNSFYGQTVIRESKQKKPDEENKPKENPDKPERHP
jgi:hypothetical protein